MKNKILLVICVTLIGHSVKGQQNQSQLDKKSILEVIKNTSNVLINNYVFPDKAEKMSYYINQQSKEGKYSELTNPNKLADKLTADLNSQFEDKHLRIVYNPGLEKDILDFVKSEQNANEIKQADVEKEKSVNFYFKKIEILPSNIGYIEFTNFPVPSAEAIKTIQAVMQFVSHTNALILDLRNNRGGNGNTASDISSYFFKSKTLTDKSFNRIENKWTDNYVENNDSITNGLYLDMPIYILTSRWTFSAAEGFAYTLKYLKNAKIIGEPTSGGAHLTRSFSAGNGFVAFVPYVRGENIITKTDWEGTGVIPDLSTGKDDALLVAQNEILKQKITDIKDETEKRKIKWQLNYNLSKTSNVTLESEQIEQFVGRFAEFEVFITDKQLMFKDTNNPRYIPQKMIPITDTMFQISGDYQIEFVMDDSNNFDSIKMYWNDGWVEEIKRGN
jgi:retinol-binding protein 3